MNQGPSDFFQQTDSHAQVVQPDLHVLILVFMDT